MTYTHLQYWYMAVLHCKKHTTLSILVNDVNGGSSLKEHVEGLEVATVCSYEQRSTRLAVASLERSSPMCMCVCVCACEIESRKMSANFERQAH